MGSCEFREGRVIKAYPHPPVLSEIKAILQEKGVSEDTLERRARKVFDHAEALYMQELLPPFPKKSISRPPDIPRHHAHGPLNIEEKRHPK